LASSLVVRPNQNRLDVPYVKVIDTLAYARGETLGAGGAKAVGLLMAGDGDSAIRPRTDALRTSAGNMSVVLGLAALACQMTSSDPDRVDLDANAIVVESAESK
jgi:hypothetical protein